MNVTNKPEVYLRYIDEQLGYGAFAAKDFTIDELVEAAPIDIVDVVFKSLPIALQCRVFNYNAVKSPEVISVETPNNRRIKTVMHLRVKKILYQMGLLSFTRKVKKKLIGNRSERLIIAYGYATLYNHSDHASLRYELSKDKKLLMFYAKNDISENEQITINYNSNIGKIDEGHPTNDWFASKKIDKVKL